MAAVPQYIAKLMTDVSRVEGKLDTFIQQMKVQDSRGTDLEVRTRKLENRQHWYSGAAAGVGAIVGAASQFLLGHH